MRCIKLSGIILHILGSLVLLQLVSCASTQSSSLASSIHLAQAAKINVQLGLAYLDKNEMIQAKKRFLQAKMEAPDESVVWSGMGYFLERTGDIAQAELHYMKAIELGSIKGPALNNYGAFLCRQNRFREALKSFERATQDPHYLEPAIAYANAGHCALNIPEKNLANYYFQKALAKDPKIKALLSDKSGVVG